MGPTGTEALCRGRNTSNLCPCAAGKRRREEFSTRYQGTELCPDHPGECGAPVLPRLPYACLAFLAAIRAKSHTVHMAVQWACHIATPPPRMPHPPARNLDRSTPHEAGVR